MPSTRCPLSPLSLLAVTSAMLLVPRIAAACSPPGCVDGSAIPSENAVLPENGVAVVWVAPRKLGAPGSELHLYKIEGASRTELEATLETQADGYKVLRPKATLSEGTLLEASYDGLCGNPVKSYRFPFSVGPAAPLPTTLGSLAVSVSSGDVEVLVSTGACSDQVLAASARVEVQLSPEAQPYAAVLRYRLLADGEARGQPSSMPSYPYGTPPVVGGSHLGRGVDRVDVLCEARRGLSSYGLSEGSHRLQMVATLPDGSEIRSEEVTVELRCPAAAGDGGTAASDGGVSSASGGPSSPPSSASGSTGDAATPEARDAAPADDAGCSLSPSPAAPTPTWALAVIAMLVGSRLGRRLRRAASTRR